MGTSWGVFLCNCRRTVPLDPQKLLLPTVPPVLSFASDPQAEVEEFAARVNRERPDQVLISCCAEQKIFEEALARSGAQSPKPQFINLKESCFLPHPDPDKAHAKATRLIRAAMAAAEARKTPTYNPLRVGGRVLIAGDGPTGKKLADDLRDIAQPILVVPLDGAAIDGDSHLKLYRGKIAEVKGRLGDFRATVESAAQSPVSLALLDG